MKQNINNDQLYPKCYMETLDVSDGGLLLSGEVHIQLMELGHSELRREV